MRLHLRTLRGREGVPVAKMSRRIKQGLGSCMPGDDILINRVYLELQDKVKEV